MTKHFSLSDTPFDTASERSRLLDDRVGGFASFEGWVRDHNDGRAVHGLRYEAYAALAIKARSAGLTVSALCERLVTQGKFEVVSAAHPELHPALFNELRRIGNNINQLAHAAPNAVAELLDAGAALRQAQQDALAGQPGAARQLRTATAHLRAAITRLSSRAETLLLRAGHAASGATLARLAATLQAAATGDEATRAALAQGRIPGDLDPAGFGLDLVPAPALEMCSFDEDPITCTTCVRPPKS